MGQIENFATKPSPKARVIFGDKADCLGPAQKTIKKNGCESTAILKNNMTGKNK